MSVDLNALRKTAEGLRRGREEESKAKTNKYQNYLRDLREDSNTIRDVLKENILTFVANRLSRSLDPDEDKEYRLWNIHQKIDAPLSLKLRIKPSTYFTGYWDTVTRSHRCDDWKNAGIGLMVEELNKVLSPITLVDISSKGLSCNWVYLCKVPSSSSMNCTPVCADEQNADECTADEQNADECKADEQNADECTADKQNADECKADEQNADECKADEQNADECKADEQNADECKADEQNADECKADEQNADKCKAEEQNADKCKAEEQNADKCKADKPKPFRRTYPAGAPMYGVPSFSVDEDTSEMELPNGEWVPYDLGRLLIAHGKDPEDYPCLHPENF